MDKLKLQEKLNYIKEYDDAINASCIQFYMKIGMEANGCSITDIESFATLLFRQKGYEIIHIPMNSSEIGAMLVEINSSKYLVINTERTVAQNNFSIAHELYHVLIQQTSLNPMDICKEGFENDDNDLMADAFAGRILIPTGELNRVYSFYEKYLNEISIQNEKSAQYFNQFFMVLMLMNNFRTTYMSVVIRCFEEKKFDINNNELVDELLSHNTEDLIACLCEQYANKTQAESIMRKSRVDDFETFYLETEKQAKELVENNMMSEDDFVYRMSGLKRAYSLIKGEALNE